MSTFVFGLFYRDLTLASGIRLDRPPPRDVIHFWLQRFYIYRAVG
jgi:hypothetical protein